MPQNIDKRPNATGEARKGLKELLFKKSPGPDGVRAKF